MKLKYIALSFLTVALAFCSSDSVSSQSDDLLVLENLKSEITALIDSGVCSDSSSCDYIGFGSKPCGGYWSYLVYSKSIDEDILIQKVTLYNNLQAEYNVKYEIFSDCSIVNPPTELDCVNGKCVALN